MDKLVLGDIDVRGLRVLVRVDFNVPLAAAGAGPNAITVADNTRIRAALPTIRSLSSAGAKVILLSHLGRPTSSSDLKYSLAPVADELGNLLNTSVTFTHESFGPNVKNQIRTMQWGDVLLLENTRFHSGETRNDLELARKWAELGDAFVNDAFGTAHRAHASNVGLTHFMEHSVAGDLLAREVRYMTGVLANPVRPFVAILGGAKVSDKIGVIQHLEGIVNTILVGGAMSYTFLKALGHPVGASLVQDAWLSAARRTHKRGRIVLPTDHITASKLRPGARAGKPATSIDPNQLGLDIGPATSKQYRDIVQSARTVVWNGPMGVFENPAFARGTVAVAKALADATDNGATTIVGGGDSVAALRQTGCADRITHVSTGGGAMLACLEGKELPAISHLTDSPS